VLLGLLAPPGLLNFLAHAGKIRLTARLYAEPWWDVRGQGVGLIIEVVPSSLV
jgi:hypothetical protein